MEAVSKGHGRKVTFRVRREAAQIVLEVEDDGSGIAPADAPIFDAFFSTKPAGAGLGLAIANRIVADHGGTIDVESRCGRTVFCVSLPMETAGRGRVSASGVGEI